MSLPAAWHTGSGVWCWTLLVSLLLGLASIGRAQAPTTTAPDNVLPEVAKITFIGNSQFSSRTLRKQIATQQRPLLPPWKRGEPYNAPTLEEDLRRLQKYYFDRGFLETTVRLSKVDKSPDGKAVRLEIVIDEGQPTIVAAVQLTGSIPPALQADTTLREELPLRPGKPINKEDFDRTLALLLTRLHNAHYARADVVPSTKVDPQARTAVVTFELVPEAPTRFGRVTITGEQAVSNRAIRRQLTFKEGQWYSDTEVTASADAIYGLGAFQAVIPRVLNPHEADTPLQVEFTVRERPPRTVQVGFGLSSVERFRLQVEWLHRNLFGNAEQLRLQTKVSSVEQGFEARLHFPYFLARRTTFTQTFFLRNEEEINTDPLGLSDALFNVKDAQPAFDLLTIGGESRVARQLTRTLSVAGGLELSLNRFRNVDPTALAETGTEIAEDNLLLVQFVETQWNTSDNPLNPTRGMLLRGRLEHSNTALVSDVSFAKLLLEARHYQRLWRQVILATRLSLSLIQPYGDSEEVPFNVRFFAGGPGSVRGFPLNRLGPLDDDGQPIGGHSLIEGSIEVRFPIAGDFGGALFVDFGNVFRAPFTYPLDQLRYAVGPGIRYNTPIGPVRLDVGFILERREDEDFGRVEFSIGQAF
jgi:outer membrane protein insertion porin family/translocation and assembly module TamA